MSNGEDTFFDSSGYGYDDYGYNDEYSLSLGASEPKQGKHEVREVTTTTAKPSHTSGKSEKTSGLLGLQFNYG